MNEGEVVPVQITDEIKSSFINYAMSVIVDRALPDVRDGLKPVQRRILHAMNQMGLASNRKHSKSAGVVGEVIGKYHPHRDQAIYDAMVRLAQPWNLRYPLVDGQGNFGSVDGDPAAAYRYTEARLTAAAETLLADIDKETVDFLENFDGTQSEPTVLPSAIPNLVVNGELVRHGFEGFHFFAFAPFGLVVLLLAVLYMLVARRFLAPGPAPEAPPRADLGSWVTEYDLAEREHRLQLRLGSPLAGQRLDSLDLRATAGINIIAIERAEYDEFASEAEQVA